MLVVLIKSVIIYFVVLIAVRLMGKREISEMQPVELVITLIVADMACIPINDPYIPFYGGIIPIVTLTVLQVTLSFICRKSVFVRKLMSGQPIIVIDKQGVNYHELQRMNLNMHDLIESLHCSGCTDICDVAYAIFETNGQLTVVDKPKSEEKPLLPAILYVDGKWDVTNLDLCRLSQSQVMFTARKNGATDKNLLYVDVRQDGNAYFALKHGKDFTANLAVSGEW